MNHYVHAHITMWSEPEEDVWLSSGVCLLTGVQLLSGQSQSFPWLSSDIHDTWVNMSKCDSHLWIRFQPRPFDLQSPSIVCCVYTMTLFFYKCSVFCMIWHVECLPPMAKVELDCYHVNWIPFCHYSVTWSGVCPGSVYPQDFLTLRRTFLSDLKYIERQTGKYTLAWG